MTTPPQVAQQVAYQGLSQVAHAIRRSTALWAAVITSPEATSEHDMLAKADRYAAWLRGSAADSTTPQSEFLGVNPWQ